MRTIPFPAIALGLGALVATGCTDASVQPLSTETNTVVDNLLRVDGEVCTSPPTEQVFPVKVMFIVDTSGSMQFTDPSDKAGDAKTACLGTCGKITPPLNCAAVCSNANNPGRRQAIEKVIERFRNNPVVSFSVISFNGQILVNGSAPGGGKVTNASGFTNDDTVINDALTSLMTADITTDYQGALSTAYQVLEKDMIDTDPVQRGRTKYIVVFVSDGAPDPVCQEGCGNDTITLAGITFDNWCDTPKEQWCDSKHFNANKALCDRMQTWYPSMAAPCRAYNTETDILKKVREIMNLGEDYGAGEIRLHTAFLFVDSLPKPIRDLFYPTKGCRDAQNGNACKMADVSTCPKTTCDLTAEEQKSGAEEILKKMAKAGDGLYRSFNTGQSIDFLDINYSSVSRPFGITNLLVTNTNVLPSVTKILVDSDGDGIDDLTEFNAHVDLNPPINMDQLKHDSDGDGYNDKLEYDRRAVGFDPGNAKLPVRICRANERRDRDGDGLLDCEEAILGTQPKIADTDRDRIPDGVEFLFGTDPLKADAKVDPDFDGKLSGHEINIHTNPVVADPQVAANFKYIYDVQGRPPRPDLRKCYDFTVRHVRLMTTKEVAGAGTTGYNNILVYFGEGPADDPRDYGDFQAACVRAQYVKPSYKFPADGKISLTSNDFYPLAELIKRMNNAKSDPSADPCVGAPLP